MSASGAFPTAPPAILPGEHRWELGSEAGGHSHCNPGGHQWQAAHDSTGPYCRTEGNWPVYSVQCTLYTVQDTVHCTLYTAQGTIHCTGHYTLYRALYTVQGTIHCTGHYTLYRALYTAFFFFFFFKGEVEHY